MVTAIGSFLIEVGVVSVGCDIDFVPCSNASVRCMLIFGPFVGKLPPLATFPFPLILDNLY